MIDTIKAFLEFSKTLLGVKAELAKADYEKRERSAVYLERVSETLSQIVDSLSSGNGFSEACGSLSGHVNLLLDAMSPTLDPERLSYYSEILRTAALERKILADLQRAGHKSLHDMEDSLAILKAACGEFRALADFLRV